jgi:hypothetical protein
MWYEISDGVIINTDLIMEFGVIPWYEENKCLYLIMYYYFNNEEEYQIPGVFDTEEEANFALKKIQNELNEFKKTH